MSELHRFKHRLCALESSIRPGYMISFQVLSSLLFNFHSLIIFLQQYVALDWYLVGVSLIVLKIFVFAYKFGGMICPTSAYSGIPILLLLFFRFYIHIGVYIWDITCFNLILTSTLARSLWGMKYEISHVCCQCLECLNAAG